MLRDERVWFDAVRPGLLLYGLVPPRSRQRCRCEPVLSLNSRMVAVKGMRQGEPLVTGGVPRRCATGPSRSCLPATPTGWTAGAAIAAWSWSAAGACRSWDVCMDMITIDVTGLDVSPGDEVVLSAARAPSGSTREIAATIGAIPWEGVFLLCRIGSRIERVYAGGLECTAAGGKRLLRSRRE